MKIQKSDVDNVIAAAAPGNCTQELSTSGGGVSSEDDDSVSWVYAGGYSSIDPGWVYSYLTNVVTSQVVPGIYPVLGPDYQPTGLSVVVTSQPTASDPPEEASQADDEAYSEEDYDYTPDTPEDDSGGGDGLQASGGGGGGGDDGSCDYTSDPCTCDMD